jgi:hypothetical protein
MPDGSQYLWIFAISRGKRRFAEEFLTLRWLGADPEAISLMTFAQYVAILHVYAAILQLYATILQLYMGTLQLHAAILQPYAAILQLYVGILQLYAAILQLYVGILQVYVTILQLYMGILQLHVGILQVYAAILQLYMGILQLHVGILQVYAAILQPYVALRPMCARSGRLRRSRARAPIHFGACWEQILSQTSCSRPGALLLFWPYSRSLPFGFPTAVVVNCRHI